MNPDREELLFQLARRKPDTKRAAWLDAECEHNHALRQHLEALLAAHDQSDNLASTQAGVARPTIKLGRLDAPDEAVSQTPGSRFDLNRPELSVFNSSTQAHF